MRQLLTTALLVTTASAQSMLLVANQGDHSVSVIDTADGKRVGTIPENAVTGHEVEITPDGKTAFVPIYGSSGVGRPGTDGSQILVIDVPSRKIIHSISFDHGVRPHKPIYDRKRDILYVSTELDKTITAIDPKTYKILYAIPTGAEESHMFALTPNGKSAYVTNVDAGTVSVLDLDAKKLVTIIAVAPIVQRMAISLDGKYAFTSDYKDPRLAVIETASNKVKKYIPLPVRGYGGAATYDGKSFLITLPEVNKVGVIDVATLQLTSTIDVNEFPQEVALSPDGKNAYVSCMHGAGTIAVVDLTTKKMVQSIPSGKGADGLVLAPLPH